MAISKLTRFLDSRRGRKTLRRIARGAVVFLLILCALSPLPADNDWPYWRGPNQNGAVDAPGQFAGKLFGLEVLWQRHLGAGYSGVSIIGDRLLATFADEREDFLGAFDARSGEELWRYRLGSMYRAHDGGHDGPVSTPVADQRTAYALGPKGNLVAVDLQDGSLRWTVSLDQYQARVPFWGFATTPVLVDDLVIVQAGAAGGRSLVALDKHNGQLRWNLGSGSVDYRSPVLATIAGNRQLLVSTNSQTIGVNPTTGQQLWSLDFSSANDKTPLDLGDGRILLVRRGGSEVYQVPQTGPPKQVWRSAELSGNYDTPVRHQDHLFGFSGSWLTCVELDTGKRVWRSRQPGGRGVILVDGHLVVFGSSGDVVVIEASAAQYREKTRLHVSDADGYATPSFAQGLIFVRNLRGDVAAVHTVAALEAAAPLPSNKFERFVQQLADAGDQHQMLDDFMASQTSFPILEGDRLVHFVYRGAAHDVAVRGTMIADGGEDALQRVAQTDLFYRSYPIEPGARWEYQFNVDLDRRGPDPLNPRRVPNNSNMSELVTPGWVEPEFVQPYSGESAGTVDSFQHSLGRVQVYLPAGYRGGNQRYPLVVVTDGEGWIEQGQLFNTIDQLATAAIEPPLVAVLYGGGERALGGGGTETYARRVATELVPELDRRYRTRSAAQDRTLLGKRGAAVAAVFTALQYPQVFGNCAAISYGRADTVRADMIAERIAATNEHKPRFYVTWNRYDVWRPQSFDCRQQSQALAQQLEQNGYRVTAEERNDSASWRSWRIQAGEALRALLAR